MGAPTARETETASLRDGLYLPDSNRIIVSLRTPTSTASCSCVNPLRWRYCFRQHVNSPISNAAPVKNIAYSLFWHGSSLKRQLLLPFWDTNISPSRRIVKYRPWKGSGSQILFLFCLFCHWQTGKYMIIYKTLKDAAVLEQADRHVWGACARAYGFKSRLPHQNLGVCDISVFQGFLFFIIFYKKCRTECYYDTITTLVPFFSINKN